MPHKKSKGDALASVSGTRRRRAGSAQRYGSTTQGPVPGRMPAREPNPPPSGVTSRLTPQKASKAGGTRKIVRRIRKRMTEGRKTPGGVIVPRKVTRAPRRSGGGITMTLPRFGSQTPVRRRRGLVPSLVPSEGVRPTVGQRPDLSPSRGVRPAVGQKRRLG